MSEEDFHNYWVNFHAVKYASKIKQIKKYLVCTRLSCKGAIDPPIWNGCAEIWLENEEELIASLQSKEFIKGAKQDEPNWAAFWNTLVLNTCTKVSQLPNNYSSTKNAIKLALILKRRAGLSIEEFRNQWISFHAPLILNIPGVRGFQQCTILEKLYNWGEPRYDGIQYMWFDSVSEIENALLSHECQNFMAHLSHLVETKYLYSIVLQEHWIIN